MNLGVCDKRVLSKFASSLMLFAVPVTIGTIFFAYNEDWPWLHAFYWSICTCTTVGYGDLQLRKESSRIFSIFFILIGFAFMGAAIGNIGALKMELAMEKRQRELLSKTLSMDMIADLDKDGNGVDKCEFVCAMLVQLNKVTEEDITPLLKNFDDLDTDGSGVLTSEDLEALRKQRKDALNK